MGLRDLVIKDTHRGLWYVDGKLDRIVEAGYYELPKTHNWLGRRLPLHEVVLVDVRERELVLKGQEILTADKVAIRVSILVQFRVSDPRAAIHEVQNYEDRLYTDVQLAARRALALMTLDVILTNRNQLSEEILEAVKESARRYGVDIQRADVKDLTFPGNLQEVMNRVLAAERLSKVQLTEAQAKADAERIEHDSRMAAKQRELEQVAAAQRIAAEAEVEVLRIRSEADQRVLKSRAETARAYVEHPALLRLRELEALSEMARTSNARIYVDFARRAADIAAEAEATAAPPPVDRRKR
jgi:regulator of protease activity HflC (stomatin/prohibitin superfamily)